MKRFLTKENRALLAELVRTDFKLRYQGSALGYIWSLLKPLMMFVILYIVFVFFLKMDKGVPHFPIYLLLGIVLWNFFTEMTVQSLGSVVGRGDLIRKVKIPRWMIPVSTSISALINLGLSLIIVAIFMIFNGVSLGMTTPLLAVNIVLFYLFALGCSLFLAAAYVKFRDLSYIWEVILQAGFYATPIIYSLSIVPSELIQKILLLNPVALIIQDARYNVIGHQVPTAWNTFSNHWFVLIPYAAIALILVLGVWYFRRESSTFAENI
ncbi:MAG: ABC transporter permease [Candidatus Saccharimonas sp.]